MLIPMSLARPDEAFFYALVCTCTWVHGGVLRLFHRLALYNSVGCGIPTSMAMATRSRRLREAYAQWGGCGHSAQRPETPIP